MDDRVLPPGRRTSLRGRSGECALLDDVVSAIRRGESRSLVVRGEAGIGKTALLEYMIGSASDLTVVRATGVESEMELAYASLHQLCAPMLDRLGVLPAPQRRALEIVFGLADGAAPDRFLVGLGVLSLLSHVADRRALLCVVDDAQWLDQVSALTLAFVARRLLADPIGLVFATREAGEPLAHLPELEILGLGDDEARSLLGSAVRNVLDDRIRDRLIAETRGNPLALLELPRGLTATQLAGGFGILGAEAVPGRIEESFARRFESLPVDARQLLLLAAAEPVGDPLLLWRAAERLGIEPAAVESPDTQGLLVIGERVTFRYPLVRSAIYRSAAVDERRAVHRALAGATDQESDLDRRAWHLAAAAAGPEERVALELERSAGRAQARGGVAAAAAFLQRAVALTGDPGRRAERALAAAQASLHAGAFDVARGLLAVAEVEALDELQRARAELLRGEIAFASNMGTAAPPLLLKAAARLARLDVHLARETYLDAWGAALFAGRLALSGDLLEVSRAARTVPNPPGPPRPSDLLLDGLTMLITEGCAASAPLLRRATAAFMSDPSLDQENFRWGWMTTIPSNVLWDEDSWHSITTRQVRDARDAGALARLPIDLNAWAILVVWRGDFGAATDAIAEADAVKQATGSRFASYGALLLAALRGSERDASAAIESMVREAGAAGQGIGLQWADWVNAILLNGLGRYDQALASARRAAEEAPQLFVSVWALPELVEAAVRSGHGDLAVIAVESLVEVTAAAGTEWGLGIQARTRALTSRGEMADALYREAIERLGRTRLRPEIARAHLLYGEWLRRESRRVDARAQLRAAHDQFTSIGMETFADRARQELLATGERVRKRTISTRDQLTAQERQIAQLARDGLSNPEIGARLFLSPRTVEWHLRKVFTKLGINSRRELAGALPSPDQDLVPA
jgi:DNA-binding CsgD family transcriptional regulator/tetratricopeptide (TPR) repeat protein